LPGIRIGIAKYIIKNNASRNNGENIYHQLRTEKSKQTRSKYKDAETRIRIMDTTTIQVPGFPPVI
jgi:hypothetical protein